MNSHRNPGRNRSGEVVRVAWMRMMGMDSVTYHEHTIAGRGDDPVNSALDYYASRGETPMIWGGSGCAQLGLSGEVDLADWRAVFGPGGACDPLTGERLVGCRRPGMELVVSPHKSVAELGVIGRAEDMHAIVDAERDATLAYLDRLVVEAGGRRGRAMTRTATGGLIWATSRHATTRAGDPQVHDHVLVANVVSMRDERGGWKGLDTGFLRDHLHAATAVGRMAGAAKAVELGYGIEPDGGRSGRLGGWAVGGIPQEVCELHSTRAAQIDAAAGPDGSYQSRAVAARATRDRKTHDRAEDLVVRWRDELSRAGYSPIELEGMVRQAGLEYQAPGMEVLDGLAERLLGPDGPLAAEKTFTRDQVIIAVAPLLHGLDVSVLDGAVGQVIGHELAVELPAVGSAREPVWAAAAVVADEQRIAAVADRLATSAGAKTTTGQATDAVSATEAARGLRLSDVQRSVAERLLTSGHRLDVLVGVAGSGKTTTLAAVRAGYGAAGYEVLGAATSGQAARTLQAGAGINSHTVASLTWRLDHDRLRLNPKTVLILDEAGMTTDRDIGRLLVAVEAAGAKMILAGDYYQLDAIGPGGALEALTRRHPGHVWTLGQNLRQIDPHERRTLDQLRAGSLKAALKWYAREDRLHLAGDRQQAVGAMVDAWTRDVVSGRDSLLLAYRRDNVDALNRTARGAWQQLGCLTGPELEVAARAFQAGDRLITLTPGPDRAWTTSQRATVTGVDLDDRSVTAITSDGHRIHISSDYLGTDRVGYGYAVTAHRAQGATVDRAHVLADGGGRELAYVAMSRARGESHVHLVGPDPKAAIERLASDWQQQRRQPWTLERQPQLAVARLRVERHDLYRAIPDNRTHQLERARREHTKDSQELADLYAGQGRWEHHPAGRAALGYLAARHDLEVAQDRADTEGLGWRDRRRAGQDLEATRQAFDRASQLWVEHGDGIAGRFSERIENHARQVEQLERHQQERHVYLEEHPDVIPRIGDLDRSISKADELERHHRHEREPQRLELGHSHDFGLGYGILRAAVPSRRPEAAARPGTSLNGHSILGSTVDARRYPSGSRMSPTFTGDRWLRQPLNGNPHAVGFHHHLAEVNRTFRVMKSNRAAPFRYSQ